VPLRISVDNFSIAVKEKICTGLFSNSNLLLDCAMKDLSLAGPGKTSFNTEIRWSVLWQNNNKLVTQNPFILLPYSNRLTSIPRSNAFTSASIYSISILAAQFEPWTFLLLGQKALNYLIFKLLINSDLDISTC
jgi:hypothetical protein